MSVRTKYIGRKVRQILKGNLALLSIAAILLSACSTNISGDILSSVNISSAEQHTESEKNKQKLEHLEIDQQVVVTEPTKIEKEMVETEDISALTLTVTENKEEVLQENQIESVPTITEGAVENNDQNEKENNEKMENTIKESKKELIPKIEESKIQSIIKNELPDTHSEPRTEIPTHIVLHFSSNVANNTNDPYQIHDIYNIFLDYVVSTHYVVDRQGQVYQFTDENRTAYHAGKGSLPGLDDYTNRLNHYSVSIEILAIGTKDEMEKTVPQVDYGTIHPTHIGYTEKQYESLQTLIKDIVNRNESITFDREHIIGHDEYTTRKADPGELFDWSKIGL